MGMEHDSFYNRNSFCPFSQLISLSSILRGKKIWKVGEIIDKNILSDIIEKKKHKFVPFLQNLLLYDIVLYRFILFELNLDKKVKNFTFFKS